MSKRDHIPKKIRFEVLKRDGFKCQYCGRESPDVVLQIDQISPVSKGGGNDVINLITSCVDCNSGKGDRELSDSSVIAKQRAQLDELNERREQLEMMLQWREEMLNLGDQYLEAFQQAYRQHFPGWHLNEVGLSKARKVIKDHGLQAALAALDEYAVRYVVIGEDGTATSESTEGFFPRLWVFLQPADTRAIYRARGILRARLRYCNERMALALLKEAKELGADPDELIAWAQEARNWQAWRDEMDRWIAELKGQG